MSADADHVVARGVRQERQDPRRAPRAPPSPASTWKDRICRRRTARAARIPAAHVIAASLDDFKRRQDAADGRIVLVTLAPEVPGALPLVEYLVSVRCASRHRSHGCRPGQIRDAVAAGATLATHLGNGCAQFLPRHPEHPVGTARHRRAVRQRDRRRPSPPGRDGESHGARQRSAAHDPRHRCNGCGGLLLPGATRLAASICELGNDGRVSSAVAPPTPRLPRWKEHRFWPAPL